MSNLDSNQGLSAEERYDITIDSLIKISEELDKKENATFSAMCKQAISEILKESFRCGELPEVKKRIETLAQTTEDSNKKADFENINAKISRFYQHRNAKKRLRERQDEM